VVPHITGVYRIQELNRFDREYTFLGTYTQTNILRREGREWRKIDNPDLDALQEPVYRIQQDHLGNVWLGHVKKNVYRCVFSEDMTHIRHLQKYDGNDAPLQLFRIGERVVFVENDSIFVYNDIENRLEYHRELTRCIEGITGLRNIVPISKTRFWVITASGLYDVFYDGHESRINNRFVLNYSNLSLVSDYENVIVLNDSLSLICLDNGFLLHNTRSESVSDPPLHRPCLRSVSAIDKHGRAKYLDIHPSETRQLSVDYNELIINELPPPIGIKLSFEYNTLRFSFSASNTFSQNLYFQTKLEGVDDDWSMPRQIPDVQFERLPEGRYTFLLRTADPFGQYSETTAFRFDILSPWYDSGWAYAGYVAMFLLLLSGGWYVWFRRVRNRHLLKVRLREEQRLRRVNQELQVEIEHKTSELFAQATYMIRKNELMEKVKMEIRNFYNGLSGHKALRPLYDKIEALLNKNMDAEEDWKMFLIQFEHHHTSFFKNLIAHYPELTPNDLKLCACLKLNLSSKDIASLMGISLRGVENSRYRIRKKLNLSPSRNLNDFFLRF
jgi:hypothetical protein